MLAKGARYDFGFDAQFAFQHRPHGFNQLRLAHHFDKSATGLRRDVERQNLRKTRIGKQQPLRSADDRYAFHHAAENRRG